MEPSVRTLRGVPRPPMMGPKPGPQGGRLAVAHILAGQRSASGPLQDPWLLGRLLFATARRSTHGSIAVKHAAIGFNPVHHVKSERADKEQAARDPREAVYP